MQPAVVSIRTVSSGILEAECSRIRMYVKFSSSDEVFIVQTGATATGSGVIMIGAEATSSPAVIWSPMPMMFP